MLISKILSCFEKHDCSRICQGDIIRDIIFTVVDPNNEASDINYPYLIVLSQDCDLEQYIINFNPSNHNQYLPNVLLLPAFPSESARDGKHLLQLFNITQARINSDQWKQIKQNTNDRYHFIEGKQEIQVPDLLIDFKLYLTIPYDTLKTQFKENYLITINELFREKLSQRFCNYLSRIGLPNIIISK